MVDLSSVAWAGRFVPAIYLTDGDVASGLDLPMRELVKHWPKARQRRAPPVTSRPRPGTASSRTSAAPTLPRGLRAAVHDPLWLLGRQWQVGELLGEDAAFPGRRTRRVRRASRSPVGGRPRVTPSTTTRAPRRWRCWSSGNRRLPPRSGTGSTRGPGSRPAPGAGARRSSRRSRRGAPAARRHAFAEDPADARLRLLAGDGAGDGLAVAARWPPTPRASPQTWSQRSSPGSGADARGRRRLLGR